MLHARKLLPALALVAVSAAIAGAVVASSARSAGTVHQAASATGCTTPKGTLKYGIAGAGIAQLDPNTISFAGQFPLQFTLYNGLTKYDKSNNVVGDLATKFYPTNNLKNWTFILRKGVRYSDGRPFTAEDARANILRVLDPKVPSQQRANAKDIRSVKARNATTLVIRLGHPSALLPAAMVDIKMSDTNNASTLAMSGTGTGPYKVGSFVPNQSLTLVPNPYSFNGKACLQSIQFIREPDPTAMVTDFKAGNLDVIWQVRPSDTATVAQAGSIVKPDGGVAGSHVWEVDTTSPPFDNPMARQALSYAINRLAMNKVALFGTGTPSLGNSLINPESNAYNKALKPYTFNLQKAKELFDAAGVKSGTTFTFWALAGRRDEWITMAQILQQDLQKIGLNLDIQRADVATWLAKFYPAGKTYPNVIVGNFFSSPPQPSYAMKQWQFGSCECNWKNNAFEALASKAIGTKDPAARQKIYDQMQQMASTASPIMVIAFQTNIVGVQKRVSGIWEDARGNVHLEETRVSG